MKKLSVITIIILMVGIIGYVSSCAPSAKITAKTGAQIWGENCIRCHNPASPSTFSDVQWDVATLHMQIRANLTPEEATKVKEFLQAANN